MSTAIPISPRKKRGEIWAPASVKGQELKSARDVGHPPDVTGQPVLTQTLYLLSTAMLRHTGFFHQLAKRNDLLS